MAQTAKHRPLLIDIIGQRPRSSHRLLTKHIVGNAVAALLLACSPLVQADDGTESALEVVSVSADAAWEEADSDTLRFSGNFHMKGKDWELSADEAVVQGPLDDPNKIEAIGSPARISFSADGDAKYRRINGEAHKLEYWRNPEKMKLTGSAVLRRDDNVIRSGEIEYTREGNEFKAGGNGGVRMTLHPNEL